MTETRTKTFPWFLAIALAAAPAFAATGPASIVPPPAAASGEPADAGPRSNKWRLEFSGAAESAGEIVIAVTDERGADYQISVAIERNDGENRVSSKVQRALDRALPWGWRVERDDGEDLLVKRRLYHPRFRMALVSSTVKDVRINFDRE
ncbi:hypothetical protein [Arenimonas metalli]|uniref:Uncharacterized protein n=1 Tax=Arenimonas metalli CF5-1 TaxID=1384056 RepID=A0A091AZW4_9GAMM|nr:hypothetical protein [Arenimonas metalli]KFN45863.1 hypothetical protein N787_02645 [Arenimonas metalli CF5-1]